MINKKHVVFSCFALTTSFIGLSCAAQSEEEAQQSQVSHEREELRNRFLNYYRQYLEARSRYHAIDKLLESSPLQQTHREAHSMEQFTPIFKQICQIIEHCPLPLLLMLTQTGSLPSVEFTRLKKLCAERFSATLEPQNIIEHIHNALATHRTFNTFRKLFALGTRDEPEYATEIDCTNFELIAFSTLAQILDDKKVTTPSHALFSNPALIVIAERHAPPTAMPDLRTAVDDHHIFSYILNMTNIDGPIDSQGRTLLMHFAMKGDLKKIKFLCANGADTQKKDTAGYRATDYAQKYNHRHAARYLYSRVQKTQRRIAQLMSCLNSVHQSHQLSRDIVSVIYNFAHANDKLHALGQQYEDAEKLKAQCAERVLTGLIKQMAQKKLLDHLQGAFH